MVPVTIITGFLGSGKSTLINYILTKNHGKRIAVIENEFGQDIGIESLIAKNGVEGDVMEDFYELSNGCICCTIRDDLVATLERLILKQSIDVNARPIEAIVIETTGMANPAALVEKFWVDDELEGKIYLDGIVTIVDAYHVYEQRFLTSKATTAMKSTASEATASEATASTASKAIASKDDHKDMIERTSQIVYGDVVVLNKLDLVERVEKEALSAIKEGVEKYVVELNPVCKKIWSTMSRMDLDLILNLKAYRSKSVLKERLDGIKDQKGHTSGIGTVCVTCCEELCTEKVERWVGKLVWDTENVEIFRIKGVLKVAGSDLKMVLQGVRDLFEITASDENWGKEVVSKIVFIGKHLQSDVLQAGLDECVN